MELKPLASSSFLLPTFSPHFPRPHRPVPGFGCTSFLCYFLGGKDVTWVHAEHFTCGSAHRILTT